MSKNNLSFKALLAMNFPPSRWAVDGLIPLEGITVLSSQPGSYKTWLLLHIIICIAKGEKVFGQFDTTKCRVLVIDEENGPRLIQERIRSLSVESNLPISFAFDSDFTVEKGHVDNLVAYCKKEDIKLITIDSLIRVHSSKENDANEMARVFKELKKITKAGITILITHHNRKPGAGSYGGSQEMRGSSDILAAIDCHLALNRTGRLLKFTQTKVRVREEAKPFEVEVVAGEGNVSFEYRGDAEIVSRRDVLRNHILQILREGESNQSGLMEHLQKIEIRTSINTLKASLEQMFDDGLIMKKAGERNSIVYHLKER